MVSPRLIVCAGALLALAAAPLVALIDRDGDGVSDVWTAQHPLVGEAAADDDGDGTSNRVEALAGTDPSDAASRPGAWLQPGATGGLRLHWRGVVHRRYCIETSSDLKSWLPANEFEFFGEGAEISHLVHAAGDHADQRRSWRLAIEQPDTDGDGYLDAEERALGLDPNVAAIAPPLPPAPAMPAFFQTNLEALAAPLAVGRNWTPVKIPGLREQVLDAQVNDRNRVWSNIAPGFANVIYDAKVDRGVITAVLDLGGLVQSRDGGASWRQLSYDFIGGGNYRYFFSFDISPANAATILVGGSCLSRSEDGGRTWVEVRDEALPPVKISPVAGMDVDGYHTAFGRVRFNCSGTRVFAALGAFGHDRLPRKGLEDEMAAAGERKGVFVGDATGRNFRAIVLPGAFAGIRCIAPDPNDADTVYLSFGDGTLYVTRNATAATPTFAPLPVEAGHQVIDIAVSPWTKGDLLVTLMSDASVAVGKLLHVRDSGDGKLPGAEVVFNEGNGAVIPKWSLILARWDPRQAGRVFIGRGGVDFLIVSEDNLQTFQQIFLPTTRKHDEGEFYSTPHWLALDRHSDLAVAWSPIGAWSTADRFKTWDDLFMAFDEKTRHIGNKGVGFAECAAAVVIARDNAYLATNDHGIFRSDGANRTRWRRITGGIDLGLDAEGKPWGVLYFPVGVAADESCLYAVARHGSGQALYDNPQCKLVRSRDRGETWSDATALLSSTGLLPAGLKAIKFSFSPDGSRQWLLFDQALFVSLDSGMRFGRAAPPLPTGFRFIDLAYDSAHGLLYVATNRGLVRSADGGVTWTALNDAYHPGVGVTGAGDLVLGFFGQLAVVPFAQIDTFVVEKHLVPYWLQKAGLIRATVGDTVDEITSSQSIFERIECRGDTVVAAVGAGAFAGNRICGSGLLVSRDGGRTFRWGTYNLPSAQIFSVAVGPREIVLGCSGGVYRWDLKALPLNPAPAP